MKNLKPSTPKSNNTYDNTQPLANQLKRLARMLNRRPTNTNSQARGSGYRPLSSSRLQRCIVKASYTKNTSTRSWAAHGSYLQREHAQNPDEKGLGFNATQTDIDLKQRLADWQAAGDAHVFRVIISPEFADKLDLQQHTAALMQQAEIDLGGPLEWAAIDHHNTDKAHVHLLIRGRDEHGNPLTIDKQYLSQGLRARSQGLVTQQQGLRTAHQAMSALGRQVDKDYFTSLDRSLRLRAKAGIVSFETAIPKYKLAKEKRLFEIARLKHLETLGLATRQNGKRWLLSEKLESTLQQLQLSHDVIKTTARHGVVGYSAPIPTVLAPGIPLTGIVKGMGLDNALYDQRYILLEATDGAMHYIKADNSLIKARDTQQFKNGDIITLEQRTFVNQEGKSIAYMRIHNQHTLEKMMSAVPSPMDKEVIDYVKMHGEKPVPLIQGSEFAGAFRTAVRTRFDEMQAASLFTAQADKLVLADDYAQKQLDLQHRRLGEFSRWKPNHQAGKAPLIAGEVIHSCKQALLIKDVRGEHHQILLSDVSLKHPIKSGQSVSVRAITPAKVGAPIVVSKIKSAHVHKPAQAFKAIDKILSATGLPTSSDRSDVGHQLRERAAIWQARGVALDEHFERQAKSWLLIQGNLNHLATQYGVKAQFVKAEIPQTYTGKVIAKGLLDDKGHLHVVLKGKQGLVAVPTTLKKMAKLTVGCEATLTIKPIANMNGSLAMTQASLKKPHTTKINHGVTL